MGSYFRDYYCPTATQRPTIGDTKFSAINRDHMGWLKCDGTLLSTETYNLLFQVIGYQFGGSGTQFALPDARGRVPGAIGTLQTKTWELGDVSGQYMHTLTRAEMPAHTHGENVATGNNNGTGITSPYTHNHGGSTGNGGWAAASTTVNTPITGTDVADNTGEHSHSIANDTHTHTIANTGGGEAHNNMQPTIFMGNMFIYSGKPFSGTYTYF
jgi:microcystin-dependent protein